MRYTQEYTPERRSNELLNKSVHKFINFADSFVEEAALTQAEAGLLGSAVEKPLLGLFGTAKVNVLKLNIALEKANGK